MVREGNQRMVSETVKLRSFCSEPMGDKLVSQVPGVGPIAARNFRSINHNEGAKAATIYKALMGYHAQFGDQETDYLESSRTEAPRTSPAARIGGIALNTRRPRPRNSVQFDLTSSQRQNSTTNNNTHSNDHSINLPNDVNSLTLFFASFADSCRNITPELHTDLKMDILGIVRDYEKRSREKQNQPAPSTSRAADGG